MKIDQLDLNILRRLKDGRQPFKKIAQDLSVAENTVRARVQKMLQGGLLEIRGLVDAELLPGHNLALVGVKLKTLDWYQKAEQFKSLKGVVSVMCVTGRFDIILVVMISDKFSLAEFFSQEVAKIGDILTTETFVSSKNVKFKVPYVL
ncbi:MAG: Lrp/AsnC family transcriptional regulator [Deltaproteobacteria bacterium]|nr:Lrp/AsnC family transcriptional regulator [Deltaproteobacteria bacterium]